MGDVLELLDLAEKVSEKVRFLKRRITNSIIIIAFQILFYVAIVAIYIYYLNFFVLNSGTQDLISAALILMFLLASFLNILLFKRQLEHRRELKSERRILIQLLEIIHEYKQQMKASIVEKSIVEMRLSRIEFY